MSKDSKQKLSTESYKGVRDFYPEEMFVEKYIFAKMRETAEKFGYIEYGASILEPSELYQAKSGEEIVNEQTYSFKDRGDRDITLRPEMTPTVARMVAAKLHDLSFPLRWYSIPNLFRYEQPQKGRLREHFQLNVDLFGPETIEADVEIISIAHSIMKSFGVEDSHFIIRVNDRKIVNKLYEIFEIKEENKQKLSKIIDKKNKIAKEKFTEAVEEILEEKAEKFIKTLESDNECAKTLGENSSEIKSLIETLEILKSKGIETIFDPTLMRGFDYYTGIVFEIFDTNSENKRALFGGGRYNDLLDIFGNQKVPAVGFGMGDVTIKDFLETRNLLPKYVSSCDLYICRLDEKFAKETDLIADRLRKNGLNVSIDLSGKKIGDQIKIADKQKIPFIVCVGDDEIKTGQFKIKNIVTGKETVLKEEEIAKFIKENKG